MTERTRTGIALGTQARARIAELSTLTSLSQNAIIESLILGVDDEQAKAIIARGHDAIRNEKRTRLETNRALREKLAAMTPEQQAALMELAKNGGA